MAKPYIYHKELSKHPKTGIDARHLGVTHYYTGKACSKGHLCLRYASSGNCMDCIMALTGSVFTAQKRRRRSDADQLLAEESFKNGNNTYISTNKCKHGHEEKYVGTNNCVGCNYLTSEKRKASSKWSRMMKLYNVTKDQYYSMLKKQNNSCPICRRELNDKIIHIDHSHDTKKVRGLLCSKCNQGIGLLDEDQLRMRSAIKYLKKHA